MVKIAKKRKKKKIIVLRFYTLYKKKFLYQRPLLSITFPQGFRKPKKFGHLTSESGAKRRLNRVNK